MILYIIRFIIMYIILGILCYFVYWQANLDFCSKKNNEEIELSYSDKKMLFIFMSIFWIFYVPKLLIDYFRR